MAARARVNNYAMGFVQLLSMLAEAGDTADDPIAVAIETDHGLWVSALRATGRPIYPINPLSASRYRSRHPVLLANIVRSDAAAHRQLPADTELAQAIRVLARAQLRRLLTRAGRRRNIDRDIDRLREIFRGDYLHQPPQIEAAMGIQLGSLLRQFDSACAAADELAEAATVHFEQHPDAEIITSFPGLGLLAGARVLAEIGDDRARFADAACSTSSSANSTTASKPGTPCTAVQHGVPTSPQ